MSVIEDSGGFVTRRACSGTCNFSMMPDLLDVHTIATNSVTCAGLIPPFSGNQVLSHYRNVKVCLDIAVKGRVS